jgi:hypothetical protein
VLLLLLLRLPSLLLILLPSSLQRLLLQLWAMSCLLLQPIAICPHHCRSLCPSHCHFALLLPRPPPLIGLSPLRRLPLPPVPPLQPKLRLQLLLGNDGLCP